MALTALVGLTLVIFAIAIFAGSFAAHYTCCFSYCFFTCKPVSNFFSIQIGGS